MAVPTVTKPGTQTGHVGTAIVTFQIVATESPTEYKATGLPAGLTLEKVKGEITGTPTTAEKAKVKLSAKNGSGTSAEVEFEWEIKVAVPVVTKPVKQVHYNSESSVNFQIVASGSPTVYEASGLPTGLGIVAATGVITGIPTKIGTYKVKLTAENAGGKSTEVEFEWEINISTTERNAIISKTYPSGWATSGSFPIFG